MRKFLIFHFSFLISLVFLLGPVSAADIVRLSEEGARSILGTITETSPTEVKIVRTNASAATSVPANTISATQFDQEPPMLTAMRSAVMGSRLPEVLETAQKLDPETIANPFARQDYEYFKAFALAQTALNSPENKEFVQKAITANADFFKKHQKSYHFFPVCEQIGRASCRERV